MAEQRLLLPLLMLLLLLAASPVRPLSDDFEDGYQSDWLGHLADRLDAQRGSPAKRDSEMQVEATKRSWIAELTAKADWTEETADLIDEIQSKASASGLKSLKAACKAMCPKCVCGVILMPNLPSTGAMEKKPKKGRKHKVMKKPKGKKTAKPKPTKKPKTTAKPTKKPKTTAKPTKKPKTTVKPTEKPKATATKPPAATTTPKKEGGKTTQTTPKAAKPTEKTKPSKKASHLALLESQLPDFLLDEGSDASAYKREVGDHDPLSRSDESLNYLGVD